MKTTAGLCLIDDERCLRNKEVTKKKLRVLKIGYKTNIIFDDYDQCFDTFTDKYIYKFDREIMKSRQLSKLK